MRCACIDIGSNTTRVLVADVAGGRLTEVLTDRAYTRLGRALRRGGVLPPERIDAVAEVVAQQRELAESAGSERLSVVATAAIRHAANGDELCRAVRARAGTHVTVLAGADEARLAFAGAARTLEQPPAGAVAVVDVGGGSCEIAVGTLATGVEWSVSLPVGSGALADAHLHTDPPPAGELDAVRAHAAAALDGVRPPPAGLAVAVGGSATSTAQIVGPTLDEVSIARALGVLCCRPAAEVAAEHGLVVARVRLLPAGLLLLAAIGAALGRPLQVGRGGVREGVCLELAAQ